MGPFCVCENKWDMFPDIVHCVEKKYCNCSRNVKCLFIILLTVSLSFEEEKQRKLV